MIFYPYVKLILPNHQWQVMKYDVVNNDWIYLPQLYDNEVECQQFIDEQNQESGSIVI